MNFARKSKYHMESDCGRYFVCGIRHGGAVTYEAWFKPSGQPSRCLGPHESVAEAQAKCASHNLRARHETEARRLRRAARRDTTHAPLVADLREAGFSVVDLAGIGDDVPDLLIGKHGHALLVEVKSPKRVRRTKGDGRTAGQIRFAEEWRGCPVIVAERLEDVLSAWPSVVRARCVA